MNKVFIYLRVSTDDKGQNENHQLAPCELFIAQRDLGSWEEVQIFREKGSAWQRHARPVFESMLAQAKKDAVKHIVVWRYDRISRRRVDFLSIWTKLALQGIKLHSVQETFIEALNQLPAPWDEILGRFMLELIGWLSEEESRKKSENVRLAYKHKKDKADKRGQEINWGRPQQELDLKEIIILREQGLSIRGIADLMGVSKNTIQRRLNDV